MKLAFLILAHRKPQQLYRMIRALQHPAFDFFIHLDKKADINQFTPPAEFDNVYFIKNRVDVQWAGYSLVEAQLGSIEEVVETGRYRYVTVLSAQDFPLYSSQHIYEYFVQHDGDEFISCVDEKADPEWWAIAQQRIKKYHFQNLRIPGKYRLQFLVNRLTGERKYPLPHTITGRSQWFSITTDCARYMIDYIRSHPEMVKYFKLVWAADEFIFSTVVYNSPYRNRIKDHLVYIDWSERVEHPKTLTMADYGQLKQSGKLFARKFDETFDDLIIKKLEQEHMMAVQA